VGFFDKKPECVACGDTGKNSKGGPCVPCEIRRRRAATAPPTVAPQPQEAVMADDAPERELHLEYRPQSFKEVVGQDNAVRQLVTMGKAGKIPHFLLFTGPSGTGKTTLARIVKNKLKCGDRDFQEINAASSRGIEMVRDVQGRINAHPLEGEVRVWLIDEAQQLTADAQGAFLKVLEEPPAHVYIMFATTHPEKLRPAIRTRATEIKCEAVAAKDLEALVVRVHEENSGGTLSGKVAARIAEVADGSPSKALVLLQQAMGEPDEEKQLNIIQKADAGRDAIEIARGLLAGVSWAKMAAIIKAVGADDAESIRWLVLSYCTTIALSGGDKAGRAVDIIMEFEDNFFDSKKAGLVRACYNVLDKG
jgi:replication-associated recombination protein RarA